MKARSILGLMGVMLFAAQAEAVTFSISNVGFNKVGHDEGLMWNVQALDVASFDLEAGESHEFTYGWFFSDAVALFGQLSPEELADADDTLGTSFNITPPTPPNGTKATGELDGFDGGKFLKFINLPDRIDIDFVNTAQTFIFGNGGEYEVRFKDATLSGLNLGFVGLKAEIKLTKNEVPEPASLALAALGAAGLAVRTRRRSRA